ncbi:MAG: ABC transporter substrate-binding protein [Dehalococcoidia bacterium]
MAGDNYWTRRSFSRRGVLRGAGVGLAGLAGAALIGCGSDDDGGSDGGSSGGGATATQAASSGGGASGNGIPANVTRAPGLDPNQGEAPINESKVVQGGTFRRAETTTTSQQDPDVSIAGSDHEFINDRLVYANGWTQELTPDLLESYEVTDPDGLEIVFKLRPGIKTHDREPVNGRDFTAEDVAYSINRKVGNIDPEAAQKYARAAQLVGLDHAEAVDDLTVKLVLNAPNGSIMPAFADPRSQMIPREQDDIGYTDPLKFVGTGAWIETEFVEGTRQVYKAHPNYYRQWDEGGRPGIDTFEILIIADRASQLAAFTTGDTSFFSGIRPEEEAQLEATVKDALWYRQPGPTWDHFAMNLNLPIFADDRVRQALQLSTDFPSLADPLGAGWLYSGPLHALFPEALSSDEIKAMPGYNPDTKEADIAEAVRLMDAAGYHDGEGLSWENINFGTNGGDTAIRQKDQWGKIWPQMDMKLQAIADYGSFTNLLNSREFEARTYNHTMVPDAAIDGRTYYYSSGSRNYQGFNKPWADEALDKMLAAQTTEERKDIIRPFQLQYIQEGPPLLQLRVPPDKVVAHANYGGLDLMTGAWTYGLSGAYGVGPRWFWQTEA